MDRSQPLEPIEEQLARLRPAPVGISRESMLFEAGRQAERHKPRTPWIWQAAAGACGLFSIVLVALLISVRSECARLEQAILSQSEQAALAAESARELGVAHKAELAGSKSYFALRQQWQSTGEIAERIPFAADGASGEQVQAEARLSQFHLLREWFGRNKS